MRILQVIPYFTPRRGGDVNVCYNLTKQLLNRGHTVHIATSDFEFDEEYSASLERLGAKVIPFRCKMNLGLFLYTPSLRGWLRENIGTFDIIHLHEFRSYQNIAVHRHARMANIPYVLQAHGSVLPFPGKGGLKRMFDFTCGYRILRDSSVMIALTRDEGRSYETMGTHPERIMIIPNGIDMNGYQPLPARGEFRDKYKIDSHKKIILYVGRLHESKGIDLLVRAFHQILEQMKDTHLIIAGPDGGYLSRLRDLIKLLGISDNVSIVGFLTEKEKISAMVDSDVFVTPSYSGFPITFLEASSCGLPIVTTEKGDDLEWIDGMAGCVTNYDPQKLAYAVVSLLTSEELRKGLGANGLETVTKEFVWSRVVKTIETVYEGAVNNPLAH